MPANAQTTRHSSTPVHEAHEQPRDYAEPERHPVDRTHWPLGWFWLLAIGIGAILWLLILRAALVAVT